MSKDKYDIFQSESGDILIIIDKHDGEPHNPKLYYNGDDLLVLQRNDKISIALKNLDEDVKEALKQVGDVLIVEVEDEDIVNEYNADFCIKEDLEW